MEVVHVAPEDRVAYHAAACVASNFLVTLEAAAERLGATAGVTREMLAPMVRATVENWAELGPQRALTGPVARGDETTVAAHRETVAERVPELLALFDALTDCHAANWRRRALAYENATDNRRGQGRSGAPTARGPADRAGADDGRLPRWPPRADAARAERVR